MAKSNKITTQGRELRIASCPDCKGNPPEEPYTATSTRGMFTGMKCSICWEILSQALDGVEVVKEKRARVKREPKVKSKVPKVFVVATEVKQEAFILL